MITTDPIADLLTRVRNASRAHLEKVEIPASRMKASLVKVLRDEGFVKGFKLVREEGKAWIKVLLKYDNDGNPAIRGIRRISKPGIRRYIGYQTLGRVRNGAGVAILSTSKGIVTGGTARKERIGGEYLCEVW